MKKILSVVIPAYNIQDYIEQTLNSLICDEYMDDLEVLIIDDGSKDDTAKIASKYEKKYPNTFKVICKENGGHGSALNKGIELATGKYYRPLDADDWFDTEALKAVIRDLKVHDADMVLTNFTKVFENSDRQIKIRIKNVWNRKEIDEKRANPKPGRDVLIYGRVYDFETELFDFSNQYLFHHITYRTALLKEHNIRFSEHVSYDDIEYDTMPIAYVRTVLPIDRYLYQYRLGREGQSVDESVFARKHKDRRTVVERTLRFCAEHKDEFSSNVYEHIKEENRYRVVRQYDIYYGICKRSREIKKEIISFANTVKEIDPVLYDETRSRRVDLLFQSKGLLYPFITSKTIRKIMYWYKTKDLPDTTKKTWSVESDLPMHRKIRNRKILSVLHLAWLNKEMRSIRRFKNIHKGERVFITCPGPSLTIKDLELLENEFTIGVNSITKAYEYTTWRPTYYALIDYRSFGKELHDKPVYGNTFAKRESFFHYRCDPKTKNGRETYLLINYKNHQPEWMEKGKIKYSNDMSVCVYEGFTVTNMAIQIALYMGFKQIYIIGADCDYSQPKIHFIEAPGDKQKIKEGWLPQASALAVEGYKAIRPYAYKKRCEIYNVTRGGKLEVFYRDNLERVLAEKRGK